VTIAVTNRLSEDTSIHWHGIRTPGRLAASRAQFPGITPVETFRTVSWSGRAAPTVSHPATAAFRANAATTAL